MSSLPVFLDRLPAYILTLVSLLLASSGFSQVPDALARTIISPSTVNESSSVSMGRHVAMDGNIVVTSARFASIGADSSGVVKVFDSTTGNLLHTIPNPAPAADDNFGSALACSGTRIAVGVPLKDEPSFQNSGIVYIFDLASPTPTQPVLTIPRASGPSTMFGFSVALDGNKLVVGAPEQSNPNGGRGSVYVFDLSHPSPTTPLFTFRPSNSTFTAFGSAVAIEGNRVVASDNEYNSLRGRVVLYDLSLPAPETAVHTFDNPQPATNDQFGDFLTLRGNYLAVGAPKDDLPGGTDAGSAYVYNLASATPTTPFISLPNPTPAQNGWYGAAVAISGTQLLVGAHGHDIPNFSNVGITYVYNLASATPATPVRTISVSSVNSDTQFGSAIGIQGTRTVISAPGRLITGRLEGALYLYDLATPAVPPITVTTTSPAPRDLFGGSVAMSGTRMMIGDGTSKIYVFDETAPDPTVPAITITSAGSSFSAHGPIFAVGSRESGTLSAGRVFVYDLAGATPTTRIHTIENPTPGNSDYFGYSVAIHGKWLVASAPRDDPGALNAGTVYVFDLTSGTPTTPLYTLPNPAPEDDDYFGSAVAVSDRWVIAGTLRDKPRGSVYLYDLASATPETPLALPLPDPTTSSLGAAVAVQGSRLVVTAPGYAGGPVRGRAYVYDLSSGLPSAPVARLDNPIPNLSHNFGYAVALDNTRIVVAASTNNVAATNIQAAYVFDLNSPTPSVAVAHLQNPYPSLDDCFASAIAISGSSVLVGSPYEDLTAWDKGMAFLYRPSAFAEWKVSVLNAEFAPDLGDLDADGIPNISEYAFGTSPFAQQSTIATASLIPTPQGERLRLFVPRDGSRLDVNLDAQVSESMLGPWTTIATSRNGQPFTGPGYFTGDAAGPGIRNVEIRDIAPIDASARRFLRVKVSR